MTMLATMEAVGKLTNTPNKPLTAPTELIQKFVIGEINGRNFHKQLVPLIGLDPDYDTFYKAFNSTQRRNNAAIAYAVELQQRPDILVGIISNTNPTHADWLRTHIPEFAMFTSVILSNDVGLLKPDPTIYQLCLNQLGMTPQQAIFIDDLPANIKGARALGMSGIVHSDWEETREILEEWLKE